MPVRAEQLEGGIFCLALDDRASKNALTQECIEQLISSLQTLRDEPALRVLMVRGNREVFCSGASRERLQRAASGRDGPSAAEYRALVDALVTFPLPVVGALEGAAVGGGLMLALLLCDVLVAAERSRYGLNFTSMGFTPGMGATSLIPQLAGYAFGAEMLLGGKLFTGAELRGRCLFNYVVPAGEVWDVSLDLARRFAEKPAYVLAMTKELLASGRRAGLHDTLMREVAAQEACLARPETAELIEMGYVE